MDPVRELPYGPAASERPLIEAGHMSAPDAAPDILKNLLAPTGASTHVQPLSAPIDDRTTAIEIAIFPQGPHNMPAASEKGASERASSSRGNIPPVGLALDRL